MDITNVITLLGGVAVFIFGMSLMAGGLEKASGGRLERILEKMTSNVFSGVLLGTVVTAFIQSSSATTVMVVGFVNAGIMKLTQAVGVIMGANIGTTATGLILGLNDIDASDTLLRFLKPSVIAPLMCVTGIILYMFFKRGRKNSLGQILLGFGILFFGMLTMETAVSPLKDVPEFHHVILWFTNPVLGVLLGAALTAVLQSSSASIGILQALSSTGSLTFSAAAPIILGQNIGTCITAILSSMGASKNAKRAALIHLYFNVIGTAVFIAALYSLKGLLPFWESDINRTTIAIFHLTFNVITTALILPFNKLLIRLAEKSIRESGAGIDSASFSVLEERFLGSPGLALARARDTAVQMGEAARANFLDAARIFRDYDEKIFERIREREAAIDKMDVNLGRYLLKISDVDLSESDALTQLELLHVIGDFERIGDHAINVAELAQRRFENGLAFSNSAMDELKAMTKAVDEISSMAIKAYTESDENLGKRVEPLEEVIDLMTDLLKTRYISRMRKGSGSPESGALFLELIINFERIADHCSNVALYAVQSHGTGLASAGFDPHDYVKTLHQSKDAFYNDEFKKYEEIFVTPLSKVKS